MPQRLEALQHWLQVELNSTALEVTPASSDASFRRYFRVRHNGETFIVMDAPPNKEDTGPFIHVAELLASQGLNVPRVQAMDAVQGFLLLTDLGSQPYLPALSDATVDQLYGDALCALLAMQQIAAEDDLPPYDRALLLREMELFREWYLGSHLEHALTPEADQRLSDTFTLLAEAALEQSRVFVHRDYHSRNLMVTDEHNPGILDFQDAVWGPVTYDLVSLLRDCYIAWPRQRVESWALGHLRACREVGIVPELSEADWLRWFDWMGVQRHLKAAGIFARLNYRDGKPGYLVDIPRTLGYVREVAQRYPELHALLDVIP